MHLATCRYKCDDDLEAAVDRECELRTAGFLRRDWFQYLWSDLKVATAEFSSATIMYAV